MPRQYVSVKFRQEDARTYTYHNDGDPLAPGQTARIESKRGEGWQLVFVDSVSDKAPETYATKPILRPDWVDRMTLAEAASFFESPPMALPQPNEVERARIEKKASKYVPPAPPENLFDAVERADDASLDREHGDRS